jgi:MtN3 and saliva related transmembrane protein
MDSKQMIGIAAGVLTSASLLPQLIKIIRKKKAEDVALFMPILLLCGLILWIIYGFMKKDVPIIATNIFSAIVNTSILVLTVIYKRS